MRSQRDEEAGQAVSVERSGGVQLCAYLSEVYHFTGTVAYDFKSQVPRFVSLHNLYGLMIKQVAREPTKNRKPILLEWGIYTKHQLAERSLQLYYNWVVVLMNDMFVQWSYK